MRNNAECQDLHMVSLGIFLSVFDALLGNLIICKRWFLIKLSFDLTALFGDRL